MQSQEVSNMESTTAVKERPILMHARSINGIMKGRKTQTRRIMKRNTPHECDGIFEWYPGGVKAGFHAFNGQSSRFHVPSGWAADYCPYGMHGDRLWVRETWAVLPAWDDIKPRDIPPGYTVYLRAEDPDVAVTRWRPSIYMPRWASRLTLEITNIRVERVQDISESDCFEEGIQPMPCLDCDDLIDLHRIDEEHIIDPRPQFQQLWDETNGKGEWTRNDWVWVIDFKQWKGHHGNDR
jgi:hypothetical protein